MEDFKQFWEWKGLKVLHIGEGVIFTIKILSYFISRLGNVSCGGMKTIILRL
jgi:hypothetical protein